MTGPSLRGSGVNWDIRKALPYSGYDHFEFDVPLGTKAMCMSASGAACRNCGNRCASSIRRMKKLPKGPFITDNRKVAPPPKEELAYSMESLIHHFKLWTEGFTPPEGEVYVRDRIAARRVWHYI